MTQSILSGDYMVFGEVCEFQGQQPITKSEGLQKP